MLAPDGRATIVGLAAPIRTASDRGSNPAEFPDARRSGLGDLESKNNFFGIYTKQQNKNGSGRNWAAVFQYAAALSRLMAGKYGLRMVIQTAQSLVLSSPTPTAARHPHKLQLLRLLKTFSTNG
jgi:hypothetical protein